MRQAMAGMLLVAVAACGPTGLDDTRQQPPISKAEAAIVGGTLTTGDPAVIGIGTKEGNSYFQFCSGTLIGSKTVLTAAHCINAEGRNADYYVLFGPHAEQPTSTMHVKTQTKHPQYNGDINDFGVLQLDSAVIGVTPIEANPVPMTQSMIGQNVRHVGYGITAGNLDDSGTKREVTFPLRQITAQTIESGATGKQTCSGDSGGPALMVTAGSAVERVVGVVSYGDEECLQQGVDGRVDYGLSWVQSTMGAWETPTCAEDNQCLPGCTPVDPDCACVADGQCTADCADPAKDPDCPRDCAKNGICSTVACPIPDLDCVADGSYCSSATQCVGRLCQGDPQHQGNTYCSRGCTDGGSCASGMQCVNGQCALPQKPTRQLFEACDAATQFCTGNTVCTGPSDGITRCVTACVAPTDCAGNFTCEGGQGGARYCRPPADQVAFTDVVLPAASVIVNPAYTGCASVGGGAWAVVSLLCTLRRRRRLNSTRG